MTTVVAGTLCAPGEPRAGWVAIDDDLIVDVGTGRASRGALDVGDGLVTPGFIDLQVNGVGADDFGDAPPDGWRRAGQTLLTHGVTSYCPTFVTAPLDAYPRMLDAAAAARRTAELEQLPTIVGVHLEGPFLGAAPGAHPVDLLRPVDLGFLEQVLGAHEHLVRVVTLAPEADPGLAGIRKLVDAGVVVALGHTRATYDEACDAADAGARLVTHLFNGMGPLHHRDPGVAGAALDDERLTPTLIADLVHVHPAVLRFAIACKPRLALVSDAVAVGRHGVHAEGGAAVLEDGTLSGATVLLDRAVANVVAAGVPVGHAVELATRVPADLLGLTDRGRLEPGARADVLVLDPGSLAVRSAWLHGRQTGALSS